MYHIILITMTIYYIIYWTKSPFQAFSQYEISTAIAKKSKQGMLDYNIIYPKWRLYPYASNWHICYEIRQYKIVNLGALSYLDWWQVHVYVFLNHSRNMTHFLWISLAWQVRIPVYTQIACYTMQCTFLLSWAILDPILKPYLVAYMKYTRCVIL